MANYEVPENPTYNANIRKLEDTDPASASTIFNPLIQQIVTNTHAVKKSVDSLNDSANTAANETKAVAAAAKAAADEAKVIASGKADANHTHATVNGYTVNADVPSGAKFTDTTYGNASASSPGLVSTSTQTFAGAKTFNAAVTVNSNITATGNITGAKVYNAVWNADYAEGFDYEGDAPKPGEIIELCGNNKVRAAAAGSNMIIGVCSNTYWALAGCSIDDIKRGVKVAVGIAGQLPIKVCGAVKYGDYIVCGGDGIGEARDKPRAGQVVGRAMESNESLEIKDVNCIIQIR